MYKNSIKIVSLIFVASLAGSCSQDDNYIFEDYPSSVVNTDPAGSPARSIIENWSNHSG